MSEVLQLLSEYKKASRAGGSADPRPYLARVSGSERELLAGLIDAYLEQAPRREFDVEQFQGSPAATIAEEVQRSLSGESGIWPALLPQLRRRAELKRSELVRELAARLGAQAQEQKVGEYYHRMEQGLLPAAGVSETVLDALGKIVGWTAEALRTAGELPAAGPPRSDAGAVFARTHRGDAPAHPPDPGSALSAGEWDEVDRLFRGAPPSA
jgi:hypothetical protein